MLKNCIYAALLWAVFMNNAFAYIDPGMGSFFVQMLATAVIAGLATFKMWWYRVKMLFTKKNKSGDEQE